METYDHNNNNNNNNNDKPPRSVRLAIGHPGNGPVISITTYLTVDLETIF